MARNWSMLFGTVSTVLLAAGGCLVAHCYGAFVTATAWTGYLMALITGILGLICLLVGFITWHIFTLAPSSSHSWSGLQAQYLAYHILALLGERKFSQLKKDAKKCRTVQQQTLLRILQENKDTVYGRSHKFDEITSCEEFAENVPLATYTHFEPYIERIVEGEENVLCKPEIVHFGLTSGTTGKIKCFPITAMYKDMVIAMIYMRVLRRRAPVPLGRILALRYKPKVKKSPTGINMSSLGYYTAPYLPHHLSPKPAFDIPKEKPALYVHARFGLAEKYVVSLDGMMSGFVYSFFQTIEHSWEELCHDIEHGQLKPDLDIEPEIREQLQPYLNADPERAAELRAEFAKGFDGIAKRIWPSMTNVIMMATGGFAPHANIVMNFYAKGLIIPSFSHGATEGLVGFSLSDDIDDFTSTPLPYWGFYEFIEESHIGDSEPMTLFMDQLEKGVSYEVVITNPSGLYRYRLGDVIKVVDFFGQCPTYEFQYRVGQLLSVAGEKTDEAVFYRAVHQTVESWSGVQLLDYTAMENIVYEQVIGSLTDSKHYVLMVELESRGGEFVLDQSHIKEFDMSLQQCSEAYTRLRTNGTIGAMQVIQIRQGGFQNLKHHMIRDSGNQQFKMSRALRNHELINVLLSEKIQ